MIIFVTVISVFTTVFAENTNAWQHAPLIKYTDPKQIEDILPVYNYPYLMQNAEEVLPPDAVTVTEVTTASPAGQDPFKQSTGVEVYPNNNEKYIIDNIQKQNNLPQSDTKCQNSQILIEIMNKLLAVLNKSLEDGFNHINKVTSILDTVKQYLDETPNSLNNNDLNVRIKNLNNRVDNEFRFVPWNNNSVPDSNVPDNKNVPDFNNFSNMPDIANDLANKINMAKLQNPNCREALMKIMEIAQNAYKQVADSPICSSYPAPAPTFQPYNPTFDVNVHVVHNYNNIEPYQTTRPSFKYNFKPLAKPNDAYSSNAVPEIVMMPDQYKLIEPYTKLSGMIMDNIKKQPQYTYPTKNDNNLLTERQKQYIANLTFNKDMLNNLGYTDNARNPMPNSGDQKQTPYGIYPNIQFNHQITQTIPNNNKLVSPNIQYISSNVKTQSYLTPLPTQITKVYPNSFGQNTYQEGNQMIQNRYPQVNPNYISNVQPSPNNNNNYQMINKNLESLSNIYKRLESYYNPSVPNLNLSLNNNNNNFIHYTERSIQGKSIPHSAIASAQAEASASQKQAVNYKMNGQKYDQNIPTVENQPYNNYVKTSNSDLVQVYNVQNQNKINVPYEIQNSYTNENYMNHLVNGNANVEVDVTNLNKLNLNSDKLGMIELTYLLKRPKTIVYQPYYLVKYKIPYNDFVVNVQNNQNSNNLRNPSYLYERLVKHANLTELSPALKDLDQNTISDMVVTNGTILNAKLIGNNDNNDKFLKEQLDIIRTFNSQFEMKELDDIVNQLNRVHDGEANRNNNLIPVANANLQHYRRNSDTNLNVTESNVNTTEINGKAESTKTDEPLPLKDYYKMIPEYYGQNQHDIKH